MCVWALGGLMREMLWPFSAAHFQLWGEIEGFPDSDYRPFVAVFVRSFSLFTLSSHCLSLDVPIVLQTGTGRLIVEC